MRGTRAKALKQVVIDQIGAQVWIRYAYEGRTRVNVGAGGFYRQVKKGYLKGKR